MCSVPVRGVLTVYVLLAGFQDLMTPGYQSCSPSHLVQCERFSVQVLRCSNLADTTADRLGCAQCNVGTLAAGLLGCMSAKAVGHLH